jgi:hypothetical protein
MLISSTNRCNLQQTFTLAEHLKLGYRHFQLGHFLSGIEDYSSTLYYESHTLRLPYKCLKLILDT